MSPVLAVLPATPPPLISSCLDLPAEIWLRMAEFLASGDRLNLALVDRSRYHLLTVDPWAAERRLGVVCQPDNVSCKPVGRALCVEYKRGHFWWSGQPSFIPAKLPPSQPYDQLERALREVAAKLGGAVLPDHDPATTGRSLLTATRLELVSLPPHGTSQLLATAAAAYRARYDVPATSRIPLFPNLDSLVLSPYFAASLHDLAADLHDPGTELSINGEPALGPRGGSRPRVASRSHLVRSRAPRFLKLLVSASRISHLCVTFVDGHDARGWNRLQRSLYYAAARDAQDAVWDLLAFIRDSWALTTAFVDSAGSGCSVASLRCWLGHERPHLTFTAHGVMVQDELLVVPGFHSTFVFALTPEYSMLPTHLANLWPQRQHGFGPYQTRHGVRSYAKTRRQQLAPLFAKKRCGTYGSDTSITIAGLAAADVADFYGDRSGWMGQFGPWRDSVVPKRASADLEAKITVLADDEALCEAVMGCCTACGRRDWIRRAIVRKMFW